MRTLIILPIIALFFASIACSSASEPIVFTSDRDGNMEIFAIDPDNAAELVNLTKSADNEFAPAISPNGRMLAFLSGDDRENALNVLSLHNENHPRITIGSMEGGHRDHSWAPSSERISYLVQNGGDPTSHVVGYDGSFVMDLTSVVADEIGGWSYDGSTVAFVVNRDGAQGIYLRNPDGVNEVRLTTTPDYNPVWSPNSHKIAFLSDRDGNPEVYVMNSDASEQRRLTQTSSAEYDITWSPDGRKLAFVGEEDGNAEIYVVDVRSGETDRLTRNGVRDDQPVWSPDGNRIAFVSYLDGDGEIIMMDANGKNQVRLTNNAFDDSSPAW